jgi:uncharacterized protein (TIGR02466 family)
MLNYENIFPTIVAYETDVFSFEENEKIVSLCYSIKNSIEEKKSNWLSGHSSPYNTMTSYDLSLDKNFNFFTDKITEKIHEYAKKYNDDNSYICTNSWFNIYKNNNYQEPHSHYNCSYSAVYFPKAPSGSGDIVFQNPNIYEILPSEDSLVGTSTWKYTPVEGMLVIFKSNLRHFVLHGTNIEDRVSIASNYILDPQQYVSMHKKVKYE